MNNASSNSLSNNYYCSSTSVEDVINGINSLSLHVQDTESQGPNSIQSQDENGRDQSEFIEDEDFDLDHETTGTGLMSLPTEMREKIIRHLSEQDFLSLRLVCEKLREEVDTFGLFSIKVTPETKLEDRIEIPFPHLSCLTIDNDTYPIQWGTDPKDSVFNIFVNRIEFGTLKTLGSLQMIQNASLETYSFTRPIPELNWPCLTNLKIEYLTPMSAGEEYMLDNVDTLLEQNFARLQSLSISMSSRSSKTQQATFSVRVSRFVAKHWKSLQNLVMNINADKCVPSLPPHLQPQYVSTLKAGLTPGEMVNFQKVQLESLELYIREMNCPRCSIWKGFIQQQTKLRTLLITVISAEYLEPNFISDPNNPNQFQNLEHLYINLYGIIGYYPFDFKRLKGAPVLQNLSICREWDAWPQLTRPDLLNMQAIPENLRTLTISGLLILSEDVEVLLNKTPGLINLVLVNCGSGYDIGVNISHIPLIGFHPSLQDALIDFNTAHPDQTRSLYELQVALKEMISNNGGSGSSSSSWKTSHLGDHGFIPFHRFEFTKSMGRLLEHDMSPPVSEHVDGSASVPEKQQSWNLSSTLPPKSPRKNDFMFMLDEDDEDDDLPLPYEEE